MSAALIFVLSLSLPAPGVQDAGLVDPRSPEGAAVMAPVEALFAALSARDPSGLEDRIDRSGRIAAVIERPDGSRAHVSVDWDGFLGSLRPAPQAYEEVMPAPLVAIDGDIAMVWGRYVFRIDGAISHCGVNHLDLARRDDVWRIVNITWTQRTTGCDAIDPR